MFDWSIDNDADEPRITYVNHRCCFLFIGRLFSVIAKQFLSDRRNVISQPTALHYFSSPSNAEQKFYRSAELSQK